VPLPERDADGVTLTDTLLLRDADDDVDADIERVELADAERDAVGDTLGDEPDE
jgi:hypothetical protein